MNVSRRKQNHPSRSASSPSALEEECAVSSTSPNPSFLPAGTSLGPFPVRPATEGDSPRDTITIRDVAGRSFGFALLGTESRALKALGEAHSASEANATVSPISEEGTARALQVLVTMPANSLADLRALFVDVSPPPKQPFVCALCRTASFASMEQLRAHQRSHRPPSNATVISDSQFSTAMSQLMRTPMLPLPILLPVAYHNQEDPSVVQLIGHPQVFVPVAVHRGPAQYRSAPLVLDEGMTQSVDVPSQLPVGPFSLQVVTASADGSILEKPASSEHEEPKAKRVKTEEPFEDVQMPLDLSKKRLRPASLPEPSLRATPTTKPQKHPEGAVEAAEKPFVCDCGVAFSNRETLLGHQRFYCRNRPGADDTPREAVRKSMSFACPYSPSCSFEGTSSTQLNSHIRQQHNTVRGYMCTFCGYRGQSIRGMRSHFKEHELAHNIDIQNEKELIFEITKDTAMFTCSLCRNEIPRVFQPKHKCIETIILS